MELIQCIEDLLRYDPTRRATTADCIEHPYFSQIAPRLLPIKGRAPQQPARVPAPLGVDPTAARQGLPPSHSHMAASARPAFGEAPQQQQQQQQRIPFYRPPPQNVEDSLPIYRGGAAEQQYPSVPESVSMNSMNSQQSSGIPQRNDMADFAAGAGAAAPSNGAWLSPPVQGSRNPSFSLTRPTQQQLGVAAYSDGYSRTSFETASPAAAASSAAPTSSDPKKAKKEADKAAKQAEKAKRLAQEKAARDRARAVMQKRNQILASSTVKEQVEWLSSSSPPGRQSDKSRGKQSTSNASSQSSQPSGLSPLESPISPYSPAAPYSPSQYLASQRGPPTNQQFYEMRDNGRPISMQSYATGDSDPGPQGRRQMAGYPNELQRQGSASSLSSGLDIMAAQNQQGYHPSRLYHPSQAGSFDSFRSGGGHNGENSLDHQLVSNMEAMTAAERQSGSMSPGPIHLIGGRPSISRQSGKSRSRASSIHRAGSASPLHHTMAPRFHPYGLPGPPPPQSSHSQSSSHSHFSGGIHLPSLQQSLEEERRRSGASSANRPGQQGVAGRRSSQSQTRPTASRGSAWSSGGGEPGVGTGGGGASMGVAYGYSNSPAAASVNLHYAGERERGVNPMWGGGGHGAEPSSSPAGYGQQARLPPISSLMSAAESSEDNETIGQPDSEMSVYSYQQTQQQVPPPHRR